MLHEFFYPSELSDHHPVRILYGFVEQSYDSQKKVTLVVFAPKIRGTTFNNLTGKTRNPLVGAILSKHFYKIQLRYINVAYISPDISKPNTFVGVNWSVEITNDSQIELVNEIRLKGSHAKNFVDLLNANILGDFSSVFNQVYLKKTS